MPRTVFKTLFILSCILFVLSCNKKTNTVISSNAQEELDKEKMDTLLVRVETPQPSENGQIKKLPSVTPKIYVVAALEKTDCYGNCPSFKFQLLSNGEATYEGRKFVNRFGKFVADVDEATILFIKERADELDIIKLNDTYPTNRHFLNDLPLTISTMGNGRNNISIKNNYDAPKALLEYEIFLEDLIEILEWRRADMP